MNEANKKYIDEIALWLGQGSINFFGMEFSGKDTQAAVLADIFGGAVMGGGEILRNSRIPDRVQEALDRGEYIPTKDYVEIVLPYLNSPSFYKKPLMLSAVGRWLGEEQSVIAATKASGHPIKAAVYINIDRQTALARFAVAQRGRSDDFEANVMQRISEFTKKTLPVIEVYRKLDLLIEVDGTKTIEEVANDILEKLYQKTKALKSGE